MRGYTLYSNLLIKIIFRYIYICVQLPPKVHNNTFKTHVRLIRSAPRRPTQQKNISIYYVSSQLLIELI